jgi:hypothetical protein
MPRLRLYDCRVSRLPDVIGVCQTDIPGIAEYVNAAQQRLLYAPEAGDESWYGTWAEVRLNVSRAAPYITLPREIARLEAVTVCDRPVPVFNQFYEYMLFGNGRMQQRHHHRGHRQHHMKAAYTRNNEPLFTEVYGGPQFISVFASDSADVTGNKRMLVQGIDQNGQVVYTNDGGNTILGEFVTLKAPFVTTLNQFVRVTGIQKDVTSGPVQIFQMNPTSGEQVLLSTVEPGEQTTNYRRYYFDHLPCSCCGPHHGPVPDSKCVMPQVTAIAKLDLIPVVNDTDWLLFQNLEAVIEECSAVRFSKMDNASSQQQAEIHHKRAVRLLNGELSHYLGLNTPGVQMHVFGSAKLERQAIGTLF